MTVAICVAAVAVTIATVYLIKDVRAYGNHAMTDGHYCLFWFGVGVGAIVACGAITFS
jgi:hypothetical protein